VSVGNSPMNMRRVDSFTMREGRMEHIFMALNLFGMILQWWVCVTGTSQTHRCTTERSIRLTLTMDSGW
jgi:hypothetical protein